VILLDTNVVSEPLVAAPNSQVLRWLNIHFPESAISSVTALELMVGAGRLPKGKRRDSIEQAVARTIRRFGGRIYPFDLAAAQAASALVPTARAAGRGAHQLPDHLADIQIAGIATANGLKLATRNIRHYAAFGIELVNPWEAE
jgi:toxin FitB